MILFFQSSTKTVLAVEAAHAFSPEDTQKLVWLFSEATPVQSETLEGWYVGPRREMITPWSTNAVEITQNMGLTGISRIEEYFSCFFWRRGSRSDVATYLQWLESGDLHDQ